MADAIISASGMRLIRLLVGNPPQSIADLMESMGVTRTAVTEQLNELVRSGFAEREIHHLAGRGRPEYLYKTTDAASLILYAQNQCMVVPAIWMAVEELGGDELMRKVLKMVGKTLAENYLPRITAKKPDERLRQMMKLLNAEGGLTEASMVNGHMVLQKRSCPFLRMIDEKRSICCVDQEMMTHVVGKPVRRTTCRHDGAPCCSFEIVEEK
ncbi:MAG: MarR family transcriptional regulator [Pirellulales bacterium]|nr:MarR family transcriptional regulator [Pirellulales bacterium]